MKPVYEVYQKNKGQEHTFFRPTKSEPFQVILSTLKGTCTSTV